MFRESVTTAGLVLKPLAEADADVMVAVLGAPERMAAEDSAKSSEQSIEQSFEQDFEQVSMQVSEQTEATR